MGIMQSTDVGYLETQLAHHRSIAARSDVPVQVRESAIRSAARVSARIAELAGAGSVVLTGEPEMWFDDVTGEIIEPATMERMISDGVVTVISRTGTSLTVKWPDCLPQIFELRPDGVGVATEVMVTDDTIAQAIAKVMGWQYNAFSTKTMVHRGNGHVSYLWPKQLVARWESDPSLWATLPEGYEWRETPECSDGELHLIAPDGRNVSAAGYAREVSPGALRVALEPYPGWLGALYGDWIRDQERRGQQFTSAEAAVQHARDAVNRACGL